MLFSKTNAISFFHVSIDFDSDFFFNSFNIIQWMFTILIGENQNNVEVKLETLLFHLKAIEQSRFLSFLCFLCIILFCIVQRNSISYRFVIVFVKWKLFVYIVWSFVDRKPTTIWPMLKLDGNFVLCCYEHYNSFSIMK